uniref:Uncharacterized protein n=1 Tax=Arundo donax TaxID=35708 RepID=A0A0A9CBK8_ARUDO
MAKTPIGDLSKAFVLSAATKLVASDSRMILVMPQSLV